VRQPHDERNKRDLRAAFDAAVAAADPGSALTPHLPAPPAGRLLVVGAGKAAAAMARAVDAHYGPEVALTGVVATRYGHAVDAGRIAVREAGHPVPDAAGVEATREIVELVLNAGEDDLVLCLVSGGGSALLCAPDGLSLDDLAAVTEALLRSGADIQEINCVRKHLSGVKGGRLALAAAPARIVTLVVSDVVGDDPAAIASGPTVADPTSYQDALTVLDRYGIAASAARAQLAAGARGERQDTPKPGDPRLAAARTVVVASAQTALDGAAGALSARGWQAHVLSDAIAGEARVVAGVHAALARQVLVRSQPFRRPCALLSGGETTVTVRGAGRGGRNGEFALACALALPEGAPIWLLAADTDGIDGTGENAGAILGPSETAACRGAGGAAALARNDSYTLLESVGGLLVTGPTRTNVNDLRVLLIA